MKKTFRLTALILALLMLVNISASATTTGITLNELDIATYTRMFQSASQAAENAETIEVDEVGTFYWGYITAKKYFSSTAVVGGDLGEIPAYTFVKVYDEAVGGGLYKVGYEGKIGYVSAYSPIPACTCQNFTQDDPNTHIGTCVYPTAFMTLANNNDENALFGMWSTFTGGEQAFILTYLKETDTYKYNKLVALITAKEATTEDGTKVTVSGSIPAEVTLELDEVADAEIDRYLPGITSTIYKRLQLDITLKDANDNVWQPDEAVQVTISTDGFASNGDHIVLYHIHNGNVEALGTSVVREGNLSFTIDDFSYILGINVSEDCSDGDNCGYAAFEGKTIADKEAALAQLYNERPAGASYSPNLSIFMSHVVAYHAHEANICMCVGYYKPETHGYGTIAHEGYWVEADPADCPWHFNQIPVEDQATVLNSLTTEEQKANYRATLNDDQKAALDAYMNASGEEEQWVTDLKNHMPNEDIDAWIAQYNPTEEMIARAMRATKLSNVILESDYLKADSELYYVRTGDLIAYYKYNAAQNRGEIIEPSCQLVVGYVNVETGEISLEDGN